MRHYATVFFFLILILITASTIPTTSLPIRNHENTKQPHKRTLEANSNIIRVPQDYPTIQEAVDAATPGTTIIVNNGTYHEEISIVLKQDLEIIGNGTVIIDGDNTLWKGIYVAASRNIIIKNVKIQNYRYNALDLDYSINNILLINVTIQNNMNGIVITASGQIHNISITIMNSKIQNNSNDGLHVSGNPSYVLKVNVVNTTIQNNNYGVDIRDATEMTITSCKIQNNNYGVNILRSNNISIVNTILKNNKTGLAIETSYNISIIGSKFYNNGIIIYGYDDVWSTLNIKNTTVNDKPLIYLKNTDLNGRSLNELYPEAGQILLYKTNNTLIKNYNISNTSTAISLYKTRNITIINTTIQNNNEGIYVWNSTNITIEESRVQNNTWFGVRIYYSSNVVVSDCIFHNDGVFIYGNEATWETSKIENTTVNDRPLIYLKNIDLKGLPLRSIFPIAGQIILHNVNNTIIEDYTISNTDDGILLHKTTNIMIINTTIQNNDYGIVALNSANTTIINCLIQNNTEGIYSRYLQGTVISETIIRNNYIGLTISRTMQITVTNCAIYNNYLEIFLFYSTNTSIYLNYIGSGYMIVFRSEVKWDSPVKLYYIYNGTIHYSYLGNYWAGYSGSDLDGDGIGDQPYNTRDVFDEYPLIDDPTHYTVIGEKPDLLTILEPRNNSYISGLVNIMLKILFPVKLVVQLINDTYEETLAAYTNANGTLMIPLNTTMYKDGIYKVFFNYTISEFNRSYYKELRVIIDNTPPTVSINYPYDNSYVRGKVNITFTYHDENLYKVILYVDGEAVDVTGKTNYLLDTTLLNNGPHNIILEAIDRAGNNNTYSIRIIIDNTPPTAYILSPTNGSFIYGLVNVTFTYSDEYLKEAYLIVNGTYIDVTGLSNYMLNTTDYPDGILNITLYVIDRAGNYNVSTILVKVDNTPPIAQVLEPSNGDYVSGSVDIVVEYYDMYLDRAILYINGSPIDITGSNNYLWDTREYDDGVYNITLVVVDILGCKTTDTIFVYVDNTPPTAMITLPSNNSIVSGIITITLEYSDQNLYEALLCIDEKTINITGQYSYELDTTMLNDGTHHLTLLVIDKAGNNASYTITINVDNTPPTALIISPTNGSTIHDAVTITIEYGDENLVSAQLYIDNQLLLNTTSSTTYTLDTTGLSDGTHILKLVVTDKAGNIGKYSVNVIVDNTQPVLEINYPVNQSVVGGVINITFSVEDLTLSSVKLFIDNTEIDLSGSTSYTLDTTLLWDGKHLITVEASDEAGHVTRKHVIIVVDNTLPEIVIVGLVNNKLIVTTDILPIIYNIADKHFRSAELYFNGKLLMLNKSGTVIINVTDLPNGEYPAYIVAWDYAGNKVNKSFIVVISKTEATTTTSSAPASQTTPPSASTPPATETAPPTTTTSSGASSQEVNPILYMAILAIVVIAIAYFLSRG